MTSSVRMTSSRSTSPRRNCKLRENSFPRGWNLKMKCLGRPRPRFVSGLAEASSLGPSPPLLLKALEQRDHFLRLALPNYL